MVAESNVLALNKAMMSIYQEAMATAKQNNTDIAVVVVDSSAIPLVVLRADKATEQFVTDTTCKAWTNISFRNSTPIVLADIEKNKEDFSQLPDAKNALFLMGGVPLKEDNVVIGDVSVAGSVNGLDDNRFIRQTTEGFAEILKNESKNRTRPLSRRADAPSEAGTGPLPACRGYQFQHRPRPECRTTRRSGRAHCRSRRDRPGVAPECCPSGFFYF